MGRGGGRRSPPHSFRGEGGGNRWSSLMSEEDGHSGGGDSGGEEGGDAFPPPSKVEFSAFFDAMQASYKGGPSGHHGMAKNGHVSSTKGGKRGGADGGGAFPPPTNEEHSSFLDESSSSPARLQGKAAMGGHVSSAYGGKSGGGDGGGAFPPPSKDERSYFLGESSCSSKKIHEGNSGGSSNHHEQALGEQGSSKSGARHSGGAGETTEERARAREERALAKAARAEARARRHAARHAENNEKLPEVGGPDDSTGAHSKMQVCTPDTQALSGDMAAAINAPAFYPVAHASDLTTPAPFWSTLGTSPCAPSQLPSWHFTPPSNPEMGPAQSPISGPPSAPMNEMGASNGPDLPPAGLSSKEATGEDHSNGQDNAWKSPKIVPISIEGGTCPLAADGKSVRLNPARIQHNLQKLEKGLVGHTFGRKLPHHILKAALERKWRVFGDFQLITLSSECFMCIFNATAIRDAVLMKGPWYIAGQIIGLDKWTPSFDPKNPHGLSSPLWIRLPSLPLLYWDNDCIARIASKVGDPLWVDNHTNEWGRSSFARVCVRVDLSKQLPHGVWVEGLQGNFYQRVEYEGISLLCFHCGMVGHKKEHCPRLPTAVPSTLPVTEAMQTEQGGDVDGSGPSHAEHVDTDMGATPHHDPPDKPQEEGYGAWTVVARRPKKPPQKKVPSPSMKPTTASSALDKTIAPKGKEVSPMDADKDPTLPPPPVFGFGAMAVAPKTQDTTTSTSSSRKARENRVSKAHFMKELAQLGPLIPKKRKKVSLEPDFVGDQSTTDIT